jgi:hypothetical protein
MGTVGSRVRVPRRSPFVSKVSCENDGLFLDLFSGLARILHPARLIARRQWRSSHSGVVPPLKFCDPSVTLPKLQVLAVN